MTKPLQDYLNAHCDHPSPEELPLVHTSRCEWASALPATSELQPRMCSVYDEELLYLFYGRPAYRIRDRGVHEVAYCPICFILKLNRASLMLRRVMPLDSGGVTDGRFAPQVAPDDRDLLEIESSVDAARRMVEVVYQDNRSYLRGNCRPLHEFVDVPDGVVKKYFELLHEPVVSLADDRRSAIEFQAVGKVSLENDLHAVVLPESLLDEHNLRRTILEKWNALPITYPTFQATSPSEYIPVIRDRVISFYETYHFIKG